MDTKKFIITWPKDTEREYEEEKNIRNFLYSKFSVIKSLPQWILVKSNNRDIDKVREILDEYLFEDFDVTEVYDNKRE